MSFPALEGSDVIAWLDRTTGRWSELLSRHPEALEFPCDIRETSNVAGLLQHIVAVELRYAERLSDLPETPYGDLPTGPAEAIFKVHQRAMELLQSLAGRDEGWWSEEISFTTRSAGQLEAARRMIFFHLLLHSIRHYAQLATIVRRHGVAPGWMMDYLGMRLA